MHTHISRKTLRVALLPLLALVFLLLPSLSHAANITATQTIANVAAAVDQTASTVTTTANATTGTNDQTIAVATSTANTAQTSASRTMTINSLPANGTFLEVGTQCTINFSSATSTDSTNCTGGTVTLSISTHNTPALLAAAFVTLTNVSDAAHGALKLATTSSTSVSFTTAGTETSTTAIFEADSTSSAITSSASVPGVIPIAEILTLTPAGTVDTGDTYTVFSPTIFSATYTVQSTDSTIANIANGIVSTIKGLVGYSSLPFTAATSTNNVILTAKVAGTGFGLATSTTNRAAAAQINTITIGGTVLTGAAYSITIPTFGTVTYAPAPSDTYTQIANHLNSLLQATSTYSSFLFTSGTSTSSVVLTAKTPGTGFTNTSSASGVPAVAQQVTFTVPSFSNDASANITINDNGYSTDADTSASAVATALTSALAADPAVTCSQSSLVITCTARVAGTAFTYTTNFLNYIPVNDSGVGGSGGGSISHITTVAHTTPVTVTPTTTVSTPVVTTPITSAVSGASKIKVTLKYKSRNNSVKILQAILGSDASLDYTGGVTGYYGRVTEAAVEAFQVKYGVVHAGVAGYGNVGAKTKAMLIEVCGA